jgi:hypothetical protein
MQRNVTNLLMGKRIYFKLINLIFWYTDNTEKVAVQILKSEKTDPSVDISNTKRATDNLEVY